MRYLDDRVDVDDASIYSTGASHHYVSEDETVENVLAILGVLFAVIIVVAVVLKSLSAFVMLAAVPFLSVSFGVSCHRFMGAGHGGSRG